MGPTRVYRASAAQAADGHTPGKWYFAPPGHAGPHPHSAPFDTGLIALNAAAVAEKFPHFPECRCTNCMMAMYELSPGQEFML